jgi:hypothetical protein
MPREPTPAAKAERWLKNLLEKGEWVVRTAAGWRPCPPPRPAVKPKRIRRKVPG